MGNILFCQLKYFIYKLCYDLWFFDQAEVEKNEMSLRISTLREDVRSYEDQVKEQALRLGQAQDNQAQSRSTAEQMK